MKLNELKVNDTASVNGFDYKYKGITKKTQGYVKIEYHTFYSEDLKSEKLLPKFSMLNKDYKVVDGKIIL